jgi:hypothetical protein
MNHSWCWEAWGGVTAFNRCDGAESKDLRFPKTLPLGAEDLSMPQSLQVKSASRSGMK